MVLNVVLAGDFDCVRRS
ncbi:hypothetical protein PSZ80_02925 [Shigella sonnei]|uniref:Uncharacterized protein n=1 Tax=Escherichia coli TaxID=562 RepID=A0A9X1ENU7_ECOLX|nr:MULTISPECIES: hypothetical protein [Enterobacterales]MBU5563328.1 hypothetical protein [Escherichia sp. S69_ASV_4]MCP5618566.1 hypothetical protein [Klebsiella pneumoniae]MCQ8845979.1 hypothetical protein [Klebsiella sp. KJ_S1]MEB6033302.1 hypothetical protein [Escherichia coli S88]MED6362785.1 hypothetical protein [Escherichia coli O157]